MKNEKTINRKLILGKVTIVRLQVEEIGKIYGGDTMPKTLLYTACRPCKAETEEMPPE